MQNHFVINVSRSGKFYFRVEDNTPFESTAVALALDLRTRFPETEGFSITLVRWQGSGQHVSF